MPDRSRAKCLLPPASGPSLGPALAARPARPRRTLHTVLATLTVAILVAGAARAGEAADKPHAGKCRALLASGRELMDDNRWSKAVAAFSAAIDLDPQCAEAYAWRGRAILERESAKSDYDSAQAIPDLSKAIELDRRPEYYFWRTVAYTDAREMDKALADANEALKLDPQSPWAHAGRAYLHDGQGFHKEAVAAYTEAIRLDPDFVEAYLGRATSYVRTDDPPQAIADYSKAIQLQPKCAEAHEGRARCHSRMGDDDNALADYTEAIRLDPDCARLYGQRAAIYYQKGDNDKTLADYTAAIRLAPDDFLAYNDRGMFYYLTRDFSKAIADFDESIRLEPRLGLARANREKACRAQRALAPSNTKQRKPPELNQP